MEREIGYSSKVFFYKDPRNNIRVRTILQDEIDLDNLKKAVNKALLDCPELKVRLKRKDNTLVYEDNNNDVAFYKEDETERYLGSKQTNYYLFYFLYNDDSFLISLFHGLTDFYGLWIFLKSVIYHYGQLKGLSLPDIRVKAEEIDEAERFNPYAKYANPSVIPEYKCEGNIDSFKLNLDKIDSSIQRYHEYCLKTSTSKFLELTHKWNTSFVPAIISIQNEALIKLYNIKDKDITVKVPVDMRRVFDCKTRDNFSDAITMVTSKDTLANSIEEKCADLKEQMNLQIKKDNLSLRIASTVELVKYKEGNVLAPSIKLPTPSFTYFMTYPGIMELPEEYDVLVKDFVLRSFTHVDSFRLTVKTTGDEMSLLFTQSFDDDIICKAFKQELEEYGLQSSLEDLGRLGGDKCSIDMI